eukprot:scaffold112694_cov60-Phaeocystis_antarctica.AAC.1
MASCAASASTPAARSPATTCLSGASSGRKRSAPREPSARSTAAAVAGLTPSLHATHECVIVLGTATPACPRSPALPTFSGGAAESSCMSVGLARPSSLCSSCRKR